VQTTPAATTYGAEGDLARCPNSVGTLRGDGPDVWYRFPIGTGTHWVYLDLLDGAGWNGVLRVYTDCPASSATPTVGCETAGACGTGRPKWFGLVGLNDSVSRTLYVAVDGATAADVGPFRLSYQVAGSVCSNSSALRSSGMYSGALNVTLPSQTAGACAGAGPENLYVLAPCRGATVSANTCYGGTVFDSVLYLRRNGCGIAPSGGSEVICNNVPGECGFTNGTSIAPSTTLINPGLHFLFVDCETPAPATGGYQLHVML
jgi:hypothetical protein